MYSPTPSSPARSASIILCTKPRIFVTNAAAISSKVPLISLDT
ncbi:hypothetical protein KP77_03420 [Jeotgalibacillus alimentarius]|uniref:Uncharacterized protein n=1 Tax=Jeotgalibacillus alimentarius TaxID=135826 RepID=A0A0C2VWW4_9BACL|nr:hypothetical protein KP77_03420 [Jeotgalibacillus alimentarius]